MKFFLALFTLCFASHLVQAKEIHALIAGDTLSNVRKASVHDLHNIKCELDFIAQSTGLKLRYTELCGRNFTIKQLNNWLLNTHIHSDDIVFFYYTGHGFRTKKNPSVWPTIYLPYEQEALEVDRIIHVFTKRPAALHIIIADCCNNVVSTQHSSSIPKSLPTYRPHHPHYMREGYRKLFLHTRGTVIASGSKPGKRSWCSKQAGGVFTNALLSSLKSELAKSNPQWKQILEKTKKRCQQHQKPQFRLQVKEK